MTDTFFPQLFRALDLAVVERLPNGEFSLLTATPAWLDRAFATAPAGGRQALGWAFPFLEDVVHQALGAWQAGPHASIVFGPFAATVDGDELLLRATALTVERRMLLVIDRLVGAADTRPMLQKAREKMLESEQLASRVMALHAVAAAIDKAIAAVPAGAPDDLREANSRLQAALTDLPKPAPRRR